jgi:adenine-specific DNA methylase
MPQNFDPSKGTTYKAIAVCPVCGSTTDGDAIKLLFRNKIEKQRLVAVVTKKPGSSGKSYRIASKEDIIAVDAAEKHLKTKQAELFKKWGFDPIPDEIISTPTGKEYEKGGPYYNFTPVALYGMTKWRDLFNSRQKLALVTITEAIRNSFDAMITQGVSLENARIITTYLALVLDGIADHNSVLCTWRPATLDVGHTFGRQALPMTWDYAEVNVIGGSTGSFAKGFERVLKVIDHCSELHQLQARVAKSSASALSFPDNYFDAVFTDPPYYDNVPYSVISDFFYVWLKRSVGNLYPELFSTPLTPKTDEIIDDLSLLRGVPKEKARSIKGISVKGKNDFEIMLTKAFHEIDRVLKPNGIAVIVYAHKSTAGWETLVNSLLDSGLVITAAWPIHTEMGARLRAMESAALSSSIYIVARKLRKTKIGAYKDVKEELQDFLHRKMDLLWKEGVSGADFLVAAIGASVVVFGKYEQVLRENTVVRADVMLEDVRKMVTDYAVKQVLHNGFAAEISNLTRFYLLWRWSYGGAILPFDDARKLSQSTLVDLPHEWSRPNNVIKKQKENIRLLGPQDRSLEEIASLEKKDLIDVLHMALLLWQKGDRQAMIDLLSETGFGTKDSFYKVAQAISETLPKESQEKKLLEGFLAGKDRLSSETKKNMVQKRLFE